MNQSVAAFFDLDGTLFDGYVWRALRRHHEEHRFKLPTLYAYLFSHIALWPLKNAKLIVVVYPDVRLAALASKRGWPVIGTITKEQPSIFFGTRLRSMK